MNRRAVLALAAAAALARPRRQRRAHRRLMRRQRPGRPRRPQRTRAGRAASSRPRILADARASGMTAVNVTLGYVAGDDEPFQQTVAEIGQWDALIRAATPRPAQGPDRRRHRPRQAREEDRRDLRLPERRDDGRRPGPRRTSSPTSACASSSSPTTCANQLGDGSMAPENRGLTPFGRKVVGGAERQPGDGRPQPQRPRRSAWTRRAPRSSRSRSTTPAAARSPTCRATRPTRSCAWSPSRAASSASTSCRSSASTATPRADDVVAHIEHARERLRRGPRRHRHRRRHAPASTTWRPTRSRCARSSRRPQRPRASAPPASGPTPSPSSTTCAAPTSSASSIRLLAQRGHKRGRIEKIMGLNFVRYAARVWGDPPPQCPKAAGDACELSTFVPRAGFEPAAPGTETSALSPELRRHAAATVPVDSVVVSCAEPYSRAAGRRAIGPAVPGVHGAISMRSRRTCADTLDR